MRHAYSVGTRLYTAGLDYTLYTLMHSLLNTSEFASWQNLGARTKVILC
jgi:hypothetical protein